MHLVTSLTERSSITTFTMPFGLSRPRSSAECRLLPMLWCHLQLITATLVAGEAGKQPCMTPNTLVRSALDPNKITTKVIGLLRLSGVLALQVLCEFSRDSHQAGDRESIAHRHDSVLQQRKFSRNSIKFLLTPFVR